MSRELEALRDLALAERRKAWHHARKLPAHVGDTASAFARTHPVLAAGGAAALVMAFVSRRRRLHGLQGSGSSWPMALAAVASKFLPEILKMVGLTLPSEEARPDPGSEKQGAALDASKRNGSAVLPADPLSATQP